MAQTQAIVSCKTCGIQITLTRSVMGWKKTTCPKCSETISMDAYRRQTTYCSYCNKEIALDILGKKVCPLCQRPISLTQVIKAPDDPDWLIYKHPRSSFPMDAILTIEPGTVAFLVKGSSDIIKSVQDRLRFSAVAPLTQQSHEADMVDVCVYFVRMDLYATIAWGTPNPLPAIHNMDVCTLRYHVKTTLSIIDAERFLRFMEFHPCSRLDFDMDAGHTGKWSAAKYSPRIQGVFKERYRSALDIVLARAKYPLIDLKYHQEDVSEVLEEQVNAQLSSCGLQVHGTAVNGPIVFEKLRSMHHIECELDWKTSQLTVHTKDQPAQYAHMILGGNGKVRICHLERFVNTTEGQRYLDDSSQTQLPKLELSDRVGQDVTNLFQILLPEIICNSNPVLNNLSPFYPYMAHQVQDRLNAPEGILGRLGLSVENITIDEHMFSPSPALRASFEPVQELPGPGGEDPWYMAMRSIEQSDLLWREKLNAYAQLHRRMTEEEAQQEKGCEPPAW